ncbi:hypothetical protein ACFYW8_07125 [Streptomyces sp. NPDC002742]|uniref:hypothetical protein n=1 Tax=Streptomyces sp. NPDC002742 TaxID=3364663 RepID=UPI003684E9F2
MKANRSAWALVTCLVAAFVVSCGGGDGANRSAPARHPRVTPAASSASPNCSKASIRWGKVTVGEKLIAVSQLVTVEEGQKRGWSEISPHHVRTVTSRIEAGGTGVPTRRIFVSLEKRLGYDSPTFERPGTSTSARLEKDELGRVDYLGHPGRFVEAAAVGVVDASFALDCSGTHGATVTPVYGTLTAWYGNSGASMKCGIVPDKGKWFREAYDMVCPESHS